MSVCKPIYTYTRSQVNYIRGIPTHPKCQLDMGRVLELEHLHSLCVNASIRVILLERGRRRRRRGTRKEEGGEGELPTNSLWRMQASSTYLHCPSLPQGV